MNNYRDIDNDRRAGKYTLIVRAGKKNGLRLYLLAGLIPVAAGMAFLATGRTTAALLPLLYLAMHNGTYREMKKIDHGRELNMVLGKTARNMFVYGLLLSAGIIIDYVI